MVTLVKQLQSESLMLDDFTPDELSPTVKRDRYDASNSRDVQRIIDEMKGENSVPGSDECNRNTPIVGGDNSTEAV